MNAAPRLIVAALLAFSMLGCTAPRLVGPELMHMEREVATSIAAFQAQDPGLTRWFQESHAYAVFPNVGKGGIGIGGAYGEGLVYERGNLIGNVALTQATIGLQLGGQSYQQVIFFENPWILNDFTADSFKLAAQASAVAATAGASADMSFEHGLAIFTIQNGGLMGEASIGGQKFDFQPLD